jgi:hypothetical protein
MLIGAELLGSGVLPRDGAVAVGLVAVTLADESLATGEVGATDPGAGVGDGLGA